MWKWCFYLHGTYSYHSITSDQNNIKVLTSHVRTSNGTWLSNLEPHINLIPNVEVVFLLTVVTTSINSNQNNIKVLLTRHVRTSNGTWLSNLEPPRHPNVEMVFLVLGTCSCHIINSNLKVLTSHVRTSSSTWLSNRHIVFQAIFVYILSTQSKWRLWWRACEVMLCAINCDDPTCWWIPDYHINPIHPIAPVWALRISISLWDFIGRFNTRRYTSVHGVCFFELFPIGCIGLRFWL